MKSVIMEYASCHYYSWELYDLCNRNSHYSIKALEDIICVLVTQTFQWKRNINPIEVEDCFSRPVWIYITH